MNTAIDRIDPEIWQPTVQLRVVRPAIDFSFMGGGSGRRLQQLWLSNYGHTEWRDVEEVIEKMPGVTTVV